jgi:hypothetical protein
VDYTLTVAVSIAAGTAALTSAFPGLSPATVPICLAVLAVITLVNLRGLGDAARAFLLPTMVFIVGLLAILAIGLIHPLAPHVAPVSRSLLPARAVEPVGLLLLLKAFSAGCSALTGIEAIANGVPLFKPPRVRRAKRTELLALPDRLRYRFLHNHVDLVLTRELRYRPDVVVARVPVRVHVHGRAAPLRTPVTRSRAQAKASRGRYQPGGCARP